MSPTQQDPRGLSCEEWGGFDDGISAGYGAEVVQYLTADMDGWAKAMTTANVSRPGAYEGYSDRRYDGWKRSSVYVTMRDGVRLAIDIIRPSAGGVVHSEPLPVLWSHTPYTRASTTEDGGVGPSAIEGWDRMLRLVVHGYVVALVDVRGGGASFGQSEGMFSPTETDDAYEVTEWLADQSWSDGNIGMWGRSYLAITQLLCASRQPPHLKAIFPEMAWWDAYDVLYPGGILRDDLVGMWSTGVRALDLGVPVVAADVRGETTVALPAAPVDEDVGGSMIREARRDHFANRDVWGFVTGHPFRDSTDSEGAEVWLDRSPARLRDGIAASGVAIYHYGGWFDGFTRDACLAFADLPNPQKLLVDPHFHSDYFLAGTDAHEADTGLGAQSFHLDAEQHRWFDYWLKGIDNGIMDEPPVTYWLLGADADDPWRSANTWPVSGVETHQLFFGTGPTGTSLSANDGSLRAARPECGSDAHTVDLSTTTGLANRFANLYGGEGRTRPVADGWEFGYPDMAVNDAKGLTYTGEPLGEELELVGHPVLRVWIESDQLVDVFAYLEAVGPAGFSRYLTEGCLRSRHRAVAEPPYGYLGMPWHPSGGDDMEGAAAQPVELGFDLHPIGTVVSAGDRLRVTLTGADRASHEPLDADPAPEIRVLFGGDHPSRIELPVLFGGS